LHSGERLAQEKLLFFVIGSQRSRDPGSSPGWQPVGPLNLYGRGEHGGSGLHWRSRSGRSPV